MHRKFSLIHPSWTPHVLKHLYARPRLTSKFAIQRFHDCLTKQEFLWGYRAPGASAPTNGRDYSQDVGDRKTLVRLLQFGVGAGRHSANDYILFSGQWIAEVGAQAINICPNLYGWETESWCTQGCDEIYEQWNNDPEEDLPRMSHRRVSLLRSPQTADTMSFVLDSYDNLEILELVDMGAHMVEVARVPQLYRMLQKAPRLKKLAIKIVGYFCTVGVLDDVFKACPELAELQIQVDLLSPKFFENDPPAGFHTLMIGLNSDTTILFQGRDNIQRLWAAAQSSGCIPTITNHAQRRQECEETGILDAEEYHRLENALSIAYREVKITTKVMNGEPVDNVGHAVHAERDRQDQSMEVDVFAQLPPTVPTGTELLRSVTADAGNVDVPMPSAAGANRLEEWLIDMANGPLKGSVANAQDKKAYINAMCV